MSKPTCAIEDCDRPAYGRTWCKMHYQRWYANGTTDPSRARGMTLDEAIEFHITPSDPNQCWVTDVARDKNGYSRLVLQGVTYKLHRLAYEHFIGPIPDGLLICHICDNPPCCNPAHLYPGTPAQNMLDKVIRGRARGGPAKREPVA